MEFKEASRKDVRIKMALAGSSGGGKTLGSLLIAKGLVSDIATIGFAQTEAGRAQCYLDKIGPFKVLEVAPPFTPGKFVEVIDMAEKSGIKCLVIDSISDEWSGIGGALDVHSVISETTKNSFTAWKKVTPKHEAVFNKILSSPMHIICTVKKKTDYVMETNDRGKQVPRRVGVKDIAREGTEYRWILQFDLDPDGNAATCVKDNTSLFQNQKPFIISEATGLKIRNWCLCKKESE